MMNSLVCVDASLILRTLIPGPLSDQAEALLAGWLEGNVTLAAPTLLAFEVMSTVRRMVHLDVISSQDGEAAFHTFLRLPVQLSHRRALFPLAWQLAQEFHQPRAYDAAYLALAQLHDCPFWTADKRLYNAVKKRLPWVHWIGDSAMNGISK